VSRPGGAGTDPPPELRRQCWLLVGLLNVALLATALGSLVLVFWTRFWLAVGLLAVGVGAGVFAALRYRRVRRNPPA
jgi:uncharacterized membrane protein YuzA (DUF378 family)